MKSGAARGLWGGRGTLYPLPFTGAGAPSGSSLGSYTGARAAPCAGP